MTKIPCGLLNSKARLAFAASINIVVTIGITVPFLMLVVAVSNIAWAQESKTKITIKAPAKVQRSASPIPDVIVHKSHQKLTPTSANAPVIELSNDQGNQLIKPQVKVIKPTKQFATINVEPSKPMKTAKVLPVVIKETKSQQVLHAPIVVLPLDNESKDVEERLQLKPKKQQVLHPPVVALTPEPAKPSMVLKPKVVVEQTAIKQQASVWVKKPAMNKKSSFSSKPSSSTSAVMSKPTFSSSPLSNSSQTSGSKTKKPKRKIYQYEQNGITTFSNVVPNSGDFDVLLYDCFACQVDSQVDWYRIPLFASKHEVSVNDAARQFKLDPALIRAVIHAESAFNAKAHSKVGAIGLMQLMPATAKELGVKDAYNVKQNILGGSQYLAYLLERFDNDIELACAAYNAGPTTVTKYQGIPPYPETQAYVERVKILLKRYQAALAS